MTLALSTDNQTAIDRPHCAPVFLVTITFPGGPVVRLCDGFFGSDNLNLLFELYLPSNIYIYEPLIVEWLSIRCGAIDPIDYTVEPGQAGFVVDNSVPVGGADSFSALIKQYGAQYAAVQIDLFFDGGNDATENLVPVFAGKIEDLPEQTTSRISVACSGYELDVANRFDHVVVDATTYPGADPDDVGKMVPQIYGTVKRSPAIAVDAGGKSTIVSAMTASSPGNSGTLEISDGTAFPTGSFVLQVDSEQISIASRSGNTLTLAASGARGYNSTTAVDHDAGSACAEIQTSYVYLVADHPVDSIDSVYVDDIRQPASAFTAYTGKSGDEYTGYSGKAVVVFSALPSYTKQVNLSADSSGLGVDSSGRYANDAGHSHSTGTNQTTDYTLNTYSIVRNTVSYPARLYDKSFASSTTFSGTQGQDPTVDIGRTTALAPGGDPVRWRMTITTGSLNYQRFQIRWQGKLIVLNASGDVDSNQTITKGWYSFQDSNWSDIANDDVNVWRDDINSNDAYIKEISIEVEYAPNPTDLGTASVGLAGSNSITGSVSLSGNSTAETVIGQRVSVDADGRVDDGSGTYTGTAGALIQRPDHIAKHILIDRCGLSSSEINSAAYTAAGSFYATNSFVLGIAILQRPNVRNLLNRIARQSKSIEFWDAGEHYLVPINDSETTDKAIDDNRVDLGQVWTSFTNRIDIKNTLSARFNYQWSGHVDDIEAARSLVKASDATSVSNYGTLQGDQYVFQYITGAAQAAAVLSWILADLKQPRLVVELAGGYYLTDIQRGDVIRFDRRLVTKSTEYTGHLVDESGNYLVDESGNRIAVTVATDDDDAQLEKALLDLVEMGVDQFRVIDKIFRSDNAVQLTAIAI